ncbi:hypothetical protein Hamer_G011017, partial [Homarus americanus]
CTWLGVNSSHTILSSSLFRKHYKWWEEVRASTMWWLAQLSWPVTNEEQIPILKPLLKKLLRTQTSSTPRNQPAYSHQDIQVPCQGPYEAVVFNSSLLYSPPTFAVIGNERQWCSTLACCTLHLPLL